MCETYRHTLWFLFVSRGKSKLCSKRSSKCSPPENFLHMGGCFECNTSRVQALGQAHNITMLKILHFNTLLYKIIDCVSVVATCNNVLVKVLMFKIPHYKLVTFKCLHCNKCNVITIFSLKQMRFVYYPKFTCLHNYYSVYTINCLQLYAQMTSYLFVW